MSKPCNHYRKQRINRKPYADLKTGDKGYSADVQCVSCGEILKTGEKTIMNFFRDSGMFQLS